MFRSTPLVTPWENVGKATPFCPPSSRPSCSGRPVSTWPRSRTAAARFFGDFTMKNGDFTMKNAGRMGKEWDDSVSMHSMYCTN